MRRTSGFEGWAPGAPLIKKCAILAVDCRIDQHLKGGEKTLVYCERLQARFTPTKLPREIRDP
jgi:hypothetical protein